MELKKIVLFKLIHINQNTLKWILNTFSTTTGNGLQKN